MKRLMTVLEVAEATRLSAWTVRDLVKRGKLRASPLSSGKLLFEEREVERAARARAGDEQAARGLVERAGLRFSTPEAREAFVAALANVNESERRLLVEDRQQLVTDGASLAEAVSGQRALLTGSPQHLVEALRR